MKKELREWFRTKFRSQCGLIRKGKALNKVYEKAKHGASWGCHEGSYGYYHDDPEKQAILVKAKAEKIDYPEPESVTALLNIFHRLRGSSVRHKYKSLDSHWNYSGAVEYWEDLITEKFGIDFDEVAEE
jgi:hypothetical protein